MDASLRLGVDLGGTKTEAVVLRLGGEEPKLLAKQRIPTRREEGYGHILSNTASLIAQVAKDAGLSGYPPIGVGMPGSVTQRNADGSRASVPLVKNSNTTCLNGRPFRAELTAHVGSPIAFANDANCFALAEATYGASRGAQVSFGVILGTGVGGGVAMRAGGGPARAWDGAQGIAGEWGHVSLEPVYGAPCYCGRRGCVEGMLSGPAIERTYVERTGVRRGLKEIADRAAEDSVARSVLQEAMRTFGRAISVVINVLDPEVIVLGGGVSNLPQLYSEGVAEAAKWTFNDELRTRIVKHEIGDSAGVIGAALLP